MDSLQIGCEANIMLTMFVAIAVSSAYISMNNFPWSWSTILKCYTHTYVGPLLLLMPVQADMSSRRETEIALYISIAHLSHVQLSEI